MSKHDVGSPPLGHGNHTSGGCIGGVHSVTFSPNGAIIASGVQVGNCGGSAGASRPWTGEVHLWDVSKYTSVVPTSAGSNADAVLSLDLIPNGGEGNQVNDGVMSGTVSGKDTKIAVEVFASGVKTSLAGLLVKFDFDSSVLAFVKAESGALALTFLKPPAHTLRPPTMSFGRLRGFWRVESLKPWCVTNRPLSIGIDVVTLSESQTVSNDIRTTKVISFNSTPSPPPSRSPWMPIVPLAIRASQRSMLTPDRLSRYSSLVTISGVQTAFPHGLNSMWLRSAMTVRSGKPVAKCAGARSACHKSNRHRYQRRVFWRTGHGR